MATQKDINCVLVTGGAGFIGSHTVDRLLGDDYQVKILDSLEKPVHLKGKPSYIPHEAEFIEGDVRDKETLRSALAGVDAVFHLAAYQDYLCDFSKFFHVNSVGTALLYEIIVEEALPVKKVVVASSQAVMGEGRYHCPTCGPVFPDIRPNDTLEKGVWEISCPNCQGPVEHKLSDEAVINPQNQYAMSKFTQEMLAINLGKRYSIPSAALRYSIVQEPRQSFYNAYSGACRLFCLHYYFNHPPIVYEDGGQIRDYVNIEDAVEANLRVLESEDADYEVFNVGGGRGYTVLEFAEIVAKIFGTDLKPQVPGEYRYGDTRHIHSDISKLQKLGWNPRHAPKKSVTDYRNWLMEQTDVEDILEYVEKQMRKQNVVRKALPK
jgi:dTDP-L-rhamnose 4-epimerase